MTITQVDLRHAEPGDAEEIARIWHAGWREVHLGRVPQALERRRRFDDLLTMARDRLACATVAASGAAVVGFVMVRDDQVEHLYVDAAARGGGVAGALLGRAEAVIAERHACAWLAVVPGNLRARRCYERSGWRDAGAFQHLPEDDGDSITAVAVQRYEKELPQPPLAAGAGGPTPARATGGRSAWLR